MELTKEQRSLLKQAIETLLEQRRYNFHVAFALVNTVAPNAENIITPEMFGISQLQQLLLMLEEPCANLRSN